MVNAEIGLNPGLCSAAIYVNATRTRVSRPEDLCLGSRSSNQRFVRFDRLDFPMSVFSFFFWSRPLDKITIVYKSDGLR